MPGWYRPGQMAVIGIITARGGSRELPRKNLLLLDRRPLIAFTIAAARGARLIDRVVVSTDSPAIARASRSHGAEVPFMRPSGLATDQTPSIDVVLHAVEQLERGGETIEVVVTLQPTSPFRTAAHIDAAIALMFDRGVDSAVSVAALGLPVSVMGCIEADGAFIGVGDVGDIRRQAARPAVRITGGIYVTSRALLGEHRLLGDRPAALLLEGAAALDIDRRPDLLEARRHVRRARHR